MDRPRPDGGEALPRLAELDDRVRQLHRVHDEFLATGETGAARGLVLESWRRSLAAGVDPEYARIPLRLSGEDLNRLRAEHPLAPAMPVIRKLLVAEAADAGLIVAVSDAAGRLLWVEGDRGLRGLAEGMLFVEGADWSEEVAGTNAPGTALSLDRPVQILGAEHLVRQVTPWSCAAAPIHDPDTGAMLGVLDVTGGDEVALPQSLSLVRATASAVEAELRVARILGRSIPSRTAVDPQTPRLEVLGAHTGILAGPDTVHRLSLRHSELLVLLALAGDGLTAAELAVALHHREVPEVTVRAELARLRQVLAPVRLLARPYRLGDPLDTDVGRLRSALSRGDLRSAVTSYRGPVLPQSEAPAVRELRADLHHRLRAGLLRSGDADALLRFADTAHGADDYEVWLASLRALPPASPRRPQVEAHLARLDAALR